MIFRLPNQISDPAAACGELGPVEKNGVPQTGLVLTDEDRKRIVEKHQKAFERMAIKAKCSFASCVCLSAISQINALKLRSIL